MVTEAWLPTDHCGGYGVHEEESPGEGCGEPGLGVETGADGRALTVTGARRSCQIKVSPALDGLKVTTPGKQG